MRIMYTFGGKARDRYLRTDKDGVHLVVEDPGEYELGPLTWIRKKPESFTRDCLPDLDDSATLGIIEHGMLPAAWGPEVVLAVARWASESGEVFADIHVYEPLRPAVMLFRAVDTRLDEALVLCLEAAAERKNP